MRVFPHLFGRWLRHSFLFLWVTSGIAAETDSSALRTPAVGESGRVSVAAAANLSFVLDALRERFSQAHPGIAVTTTFGSSGSLFAQLRRGAPHDVFLAADMEFPSRLAAEGAADPATLFSYARGRLVLWTLREDLVVSNGLAVLKPESVRRIAIANPDTAPYGKSAKAALEHQGLWEGLRERLVQAENIGQAAQFVEGRHADAGLVALSLVRAPKLRTVGRWWLVPEDWHAPLEQGAILTRSGSTNTAAATFLEFLRSPDARAVLSEFGFPIRSDIAMPKPAGPSGK